MKRVKVEIYKCETNPELNGLIIDDMSVSLISNKKTRMTIEDLAKTIKDLAIEMREGFKSVNARIDNLENRIVIIEEKLERNNIR